MTNPSISGLKMKIQTLEEIAARMKIEINLLFAIFENVLRYLPQIVQQDAQKVMQKCKLFHLGMNSEHIEPFNSDSPSSATNAAAEKCFPPDRSVGNAEQTVYIIKQFDESNAGSTVYLRQQSDECSNKSASTIERQPSISSAFSEDSGVSAVPAQLHNPSEDSGISAISEQLHDPQEQISETSNERSSISSSPLTTRYILPDNVIATDVIRLWKNGTEGMSPIQKWTSAQKLPQKSKISRWRKLVRIFDVICKGDMRSFVERYTDAKGKPMSVSAILDMHSNDNSISYTDEDMDDIVCEDIKQVVEGIEDSNSSLSTWAENSDSDSCSGSSRQERKCQHSYVLPGKVKGKKITARDVIRIWNKGIGHIPPIKQWSPAQKMRQQSKISRWKKIVDIFHEDFKGNFKEFQKKFSDSKGMLLPVSTILSIAEKSKASFSKKAEPQSVPQSFSGAYASVSVIVSTGKRGAT